MKQERACKAVRNESNDAGATFVEVAIGLTLFTAVILGFAHLYTVQFEKMKHIQLLTEIAMGPQEPSLVFDSSVGDTGGFQMLSSTTTPSIGEFANTIGDFFTEKRRLERTILYLLVSYIPIDPETGLPTGSPALTSEVFAYQPPALIDAPPFTDSECLNESHETALISFSKVKNGEIRGYTDPGTNAPVPIGPKLYDVSLSNQQYRGYMDFLPMVYLRICSEPASLLFEQSVVSTFELVPRRLVN